VPHCLLSPCFECGTTTRGGSRPVDVIIPQHKRNGNAVTYLLKHHVVEVTSAKEVLYRATLCVSAVFAVVRCLSVCLSVTLVYCIHTAEDIVKLLSRPDSPIILVFLLRAPIPNSKGIPSAWVQNTWGWKILRFSTEIAVYLGNGTR